MFDETTSIPPMEIPDKYLKGVSYKVYKIEPTLIRTDEVPDFKQRCDRAKLRMNSYYEEYWKENTYWGGLKRKEFEKNLLKERKKKKSKFWKFIYSFIRSNDRSRRYF